MPSSPSSTDSPDRPAKRQKTRPSTSMTQEFLGIMNSVFKIQLANEKNEKENTQNSAQPTVLDPDNTAEKEQNHELQEAAFSAEPASNNSHDQLLVAISEDADKTVNTAEDIPNLSSWEPSSEETAQLQKLIFNSDSPPITSSNALHENAELHPFTENIPKDNHIITEDSLEMPESLASSMLLEDNSALSSNLCTDIIEPSQPLNILIQENDSQVLSDNTTGDIEESREEDFEIWWYDAYEQRSKGYIYLFGKQYEESVNDYVSCCVLVKNIQREIYILPRKFKLSDQGEETSETIDMSDVRKEIQELFLSKNIKSWNAEICTRKYTFGLANVPFETEYLKINYSYKDPELPSDLSGKTFLYIFGLNTTPLERFIIQNDIMGPGWIAFKNATLTDNNQSWSKINAVVNDPSFCRVIKKSEKDPQMKILSIKCQTAVNKTTKRNEIITVSGVLANKVSLDDQISVESLDLSRFSAIRLLPGTIYPEGIEELVDKERKEKAHEIRLELTEYALLSYVTAKIHHIDPDIIIGHNIWNTDLNILLNSMKRSNTSYWHKLGRLRPKHWPRMNTDNTGMVTREMRLIMSGRLVCDTFIASQELIQSKTYDLSELAMSLLDIERYEVDLHHPTKHYQNSLDIMNLVYHGSFDAYLVLSIAFKLQILSLSKQLTKLAGNLWSTSINGGARTDRNDYLLLHAFYKNQFICPDKRDRRVNNKQDSTEEDIIKQNESSFSGGLVLEPKPGLYKRYVLLLDFNSLYPSIIQEYNVCHTTMNLQKIGANETSMDMIAQEMLSESQRIGILPKLVRKFVQRRQQVKKAMKDPTIGDSQKNQFDIEQKALKGTANSMYGCLGSPFSRFYARPLAIFITSKGREILRNAVDSAEELHLDVIYGDTDSIMINTGESNLSKANQLGLSFKEKVNKNYNHLEIDVDGCFKRALLLKKKRYATVQVTEKTDGVGLVETIESKGLDLNRRDFCCLSRNLSQNILNLILSDKDQDEIVHSIYKHLKELKTKIEASEIPVKDFIIQKQLSKPPEDYSNLNKHYHAVVAMEMKKRGEIVQTGDFIQFVICKKNDQDEQKKSEPFIPKAPGDVLANKAQIDYNWYLRTQILPPIARLCAPIPEIHLDGLAEYLDVDLNVLKKANISKKIEKIVLLDSCLLNDVKRFQFCDKLTLQCMTCKNTNEYGGPFNTINENKVCGLQCIVCKEMMDIASVQVQVVLAVRKYIEKYYHSSIQCNRPDCGFETKGVLLGQDRCLAKECPGKLIRKFSDKMLYTQLSYFSYLFDLELAMKNLNDSESENMKQIYEQTRHTFAEVKSEIDKYIKTSGYRYLNLSSIMNTD